MSPEEWAQLKTWFGEAMEAAPERQRDILAAAGRAAPALATELAVLLREHANPRLQTISPWAGCGDDAPADPNAASDQSAQPAEVGPYRVLRELGRGGTGVVYLAERADDEFHRPVALKLLRRPPRDTEGSGLLTAERRMLAQLQHPHIATLLDWGTTVAGAPWLATEYIEGVAVDRWTRQHDLETRAAVALFLQVCAAVAHAHSRLVLHHDLKPANILVDATGQVKLLDFGISQSPAEAAAGGSRSYTPAYASPEQLAGRPLTAASDVYSLGVILYELLTGALPEPRPGPAAPSRDLNAVVLRALALDPARRYTTVEQLQRDLERWRAGFPVSAAPVGLLGRGWRFLRRNPVAAVFGAAAVIALVAGTVISTLNARAAQRRFNDVQSLAHWVIFDAHDAIRGVPGSLAVRRALLNEAVLYLDRLSAERSGDPALQKEMAQAYLRVAYDAGGVFGANLGNTVLAMKNYRAALALLDPFWRRHPEDEWVAQARVAAAYNLSQMIADPAAAEAFLRPYMADADAWSGRFPDHSMLQAQDLAHTGQGRLLRAAGDDASALHELDLGLAANDRARQMVGTAATPPPMFATGLAADQTEFDRGLNEFARAETLLDAGRAPEALAAAARSQADFDRARALGTNGLSDRRMYARVRGLETAATLAVGGQLTRAEALQAEAMNAASANAADGTLTAQRDLAEAWRRAAALHRAAHDLAGERIALDHALQLETAVVHADPVLPLNRLLLAATWNDDGQWQKALALADAVLAEAPSSADARREQQRALAGINRRRLAPEPSGPGPRQ